MAALDNLSGVSDPANRAVCAPGYPRRRLPAYDAAVEEAGYARALLSKKDLKLLDTAIAAEGFMTLDQVRDVLRMDMAKGPADDRDRVIDAEFMISVDVRIDFLVFIAGDNVYSRNELFEIYPFREFNTSPEQVFDQQEVGVFPPKKYAAAGGAGPVTNEYLARDVGDPAPFVMIEDLVGLAARNNYKPQRGAARVVKTKFYIGKERWDTFAQTLAFTRMFRQFIAPLTLGYEPSESETLRALPLLLGGGAQPLLALQDTGAAERRAREAEELRRRETEVAGREAAVRRREEDLRLGPRSAPGPDPDPELEVPGPDPDPELEVPGPDPDPEFEAYIAELLGPADESAL